MPQKRIPNDAFDFYFGLGPGRSYEKVAERYGFTKRAIVKVAKRDRWQERLATVEAEATARADQKKVEAREAEKEQHLQALRLVLAKGVEGLMRLHLVEPTDTLRAIGLAVRELRVELGEPSERTAVSIEDTIRREYERWMVPVENSPDDSPSQSSAPTTSQNSDEKS